MSNTSTQYSCGTTHEAFLPLASYHNRTKNKQLLHVLEARTYRRAAVKCLQQGDVESGIQNYKKALARIQDGLHSMSEEVSIILDLVRAYLKTNQIAEAEPLISRVYNGIFKGDPSQYNQQLQWSCCFLFGKVAVKQQKLSSAVSLLKEAKRRCNGLNESSVSITNVTFAQAVCAKAETEGCPPYEVLMALEAVKMYITNIQHDMPITSHKASKLAHAFHLRALLHKFSGEEDEERDCLHEAMLLNHEYHVLTSETNNEITRRFMALSTVRNTHGTALSMSDSSSPSPPRIPAGQGRRLSRPSSSSIHMPLQSSRVSTRNTSPSSTSAAFRHPSLHYDAEQRKHSLHAASLPVTRSSSPTSNFSKRQRNQSVDMHNLLQFQSKFSTNECLHSLPDDLKRLSIPELRRLREQHLYASQHIDEALISAETQEAYVDGKSMVVNCKVCLENKVSVCLLPCRHACACPSCADIISECPVCRIKVEDRLSIFI